MFDWEMTADDVLQEQERLKFAQNFLLIDRDEFGRRDRSGVISWERLPLASVASGVPRPMANLTLKSFLSFPDREATVSLVENWVRGETQRSGILLLGQSGTGKSTLAGAAVRAAIRFGLTAKYIEYEDFISFFQSKVDLSVNSFKYTDYAERMDRWQMERWRMARVYEVVVFDDIGRVQAPEFFRQEVYTILRQRQSAGLRSLVTANLVRKQIEALWEPRMVAFLRRDFEQVLFGPEHNIVEEG